MIARGAIGILLCAAAIPWSRAGAQESRSAALEEIIVTATRRETSLQDVALSVSALSEADLQSIGARDIVDYFEHVPGLNYTEDAFGGYRIAVRGIATGTFVETRPLSAFYLDETPMMTLASGAAGDPQWGGARPQAVDVARVEVLRGPQGTLFGASALGGAVRMITNPPDAERHYASVEMGYSETAHGGSNDTINGVLNAPLIADRLAVRLVGYRRADDGYIDNAGRRLEDINDVDTLGVRLALLWEATTNLALTVRAQRQERESGGMSTTDPAAGEYEQIRYVAEQDDETWELFAFEADYALPWAQLKFVTSRLEREPSLTHDITGLVDQVLGVFNPTANGFDDSIDDTIHEFRLTSDAGERWSWLLGAYYQNQDRTWLQDWLSPGFDALTGGVAAAFGYPDSLYHARVSGMLRQRAIYGEASYALSPAWQVTVGARWFEFDYGIANDYGGVFAGGPSSLQASSEESGLTPRIGFAFRPNDRVIMFGNAAEGFRPGGTNEYTDGQAANCADVLTSLGIGVPPPRGFESDSLWNVELGARATWRDRRLAANATVYHIRWKDMQTSRTVNCGVDLINIVQNVGEAAADGFELELSWRPTQMLEIGIGTAYTDARLTEDAPTVSGEDGERIPTVPEWTFSASASVGFALSSGVQAFARADYRYVDGSWGDFDAAIRRRAPTRQVLDLRLGVRIENWQIELFADNVLDERAVLLHTNNPVGEWQVLMQPRTVGVQARVAL